MTQTPDGVPCRHCGQPIFWDEICWVHHNGFADCGLVILDGTGKPFKPSGSGVTLITDPQFAQEYKFKDKRAEPEGEWT